MGFNSVYQTLKELFPQVDARLLKAVAIEHAKDPDSAVETVLTEVLPFTSEKSSVATPYDGDNGKMVESQSSSILESVDGKDNDSHLNDAQNIDGDSLASSFYDADDTDDMQNGSTRNIDMVSPTRYKETIDECSEDDCIHPSLSVTESVVPSHDYQVKRTGKHVKINEASSSTINSGSSENNFNLGNHWDAIQEPNALGPEFWESRIPAVQPSISVTEPEAEHGMFVTDMYKEFSTYVDAEKDSSSAIDGGAESVIGLSTIITQSGQICRINLLEDILEDAKNYKDVLFSATESILRLIEDVEHQEKETEQAKAAAARGGLDILEKVEEIKQMLQHAKEANEMHAGEVYGEKSILATEVRELQTRLFGLADEKDKSLALLDEMRNALEARLAASEEERKAAEKVMFEKQEIAREALSEQELVMEKVVQESKLLQKEAEENAKLRDFLMEKGQVVDELQGDISVICQDIKSLKDKFDNCVSLSKSRSIEQTSFRMASSTSSVRSMTSDPPTGHMDLPETPRRMSQTPSVGCQTPRSNVGEEAVGSVAAPSKELLGEDWELFDFP